VYSSFIPFGTPRTGPRFAPETSPRGISTDYRHNSFFIGNYVSRIEEPIDRVTALGELPASMRPKGQMTFREGSFYYPSVNNELIQLKIAEPNYWIRSLARYRIRSIMAVFFLFHIVAIVRAPSSYIMIQPGVARCTN